MRNQYSEVISKRNCTWDYQNIFIIFYPHPRIRLLISEREERRKRDKKRETNIIVKENHPSVASRTCPAQGSKPQPRCAP